jgi:hypothetical protein
MKDKVEDRPYLNSRYKAIVINTMCYWQKNRQEPGVVGMPVIPTLGD